MPRQRFPTSRRRRLGLVRLSLLSVLAAMAIAALLPAAVPQGSVLDIVSDQVGPGLAAGQEPMPVLASATPVPAAAFAPTGVGLAPTATTARTLWAQRSPAVAALAKRPADPHALTGYAWPIVHPRITLRFGPTAWGSFRDGDGTQVHDGIDIATFCGDRIMAAHDGTVLAAGRRFDRLLGWVGDLSPYFARLDRKHLWWELPLVVVIDDGNGYRSVYAHFGKVVVSPGQHVRAGHLLGFEGATGHATGCHLHYGLFSPLETARFTLRADIRRRMMLPRREIARIDPLIVLPPRPASHPADKLHPSDG